MFTRPEIFIDRGVGMDTGMFCLERNRAVGAWHLGLIKPLEGTTMAVEKCGTEGGERVSKK